jgi:hypothetical protein
MSAPNDEGRIGDAPEEVFDEGEEFRTIQRLLASVEELRALLAPLTPEEREQVLRLAREIAEQPGRHPIDDGP